MRGEKRVSMVKKKLYLYRRIIGGYGYPLSLIHILYLKERADKKSQCYPAMSTIAEELNLSRRTIQRAVADLEKAGFIKTEQRFRRKGGKSSLLYTILK